MNVFGHWFTPDVLRTLGLSLLHFLWQGAAIAALTAASIAVARRASTRYAVAVVALILMVVAPVVTYMVLLRAAPQPAASTQISIPTVVRAAILASHSGVAATTSHVSSGSLLTAFVELWFVGVLLFSLRTLGGFFLVARLRRRDSNPMGAELLALCHEMQQHLGITRAIRYCE